MANLIMDFFTAIDWWESLGYCLKHAMHIQIRIRL